MKHQNLPFEFESYDMMDGTSGTMYLNVKFTGEFGVFKSGDTFDALTVDDEVCLMSGYGPEGTVTKKQKFKLEPIDA